MVDGSEVILPIYIYIYNIILFIYIYLRRSPIFIGLISLKELLFEVIPNICNIYIDIGDDHNIRTGKTNVTFLTKQYDGTTIAKCQE